MLTTITPDDAARWRRDWEAVIHHYQPDRDDLLTVGLDAVEQVHGRSSGTVLDVGGGPGSTAEAVLRRWPDARVTVLDIDPVLLALPDATRPQARTVLADLGTAQWAATAGGPYDVVLALMTMHHLSEGRVRDWYAEAWRLLQPGGLLLTARLERPNQLRGHHECRWCRAGDTGCRVNVSASCHPRSTDTPAGRSVRTPPADASGESRQRPRPASAPADAGRGSADGARGHSVWSSSCCPAVISPGT